MAEQQPPGLGQRHRARPARTLDEPDADGALERRDLLADGGLRVAEGGRRASERAFLREGLQGGEMPQFDAEPAIRFHNGLQS